MTEGHQHNERTGSPDSSVHGNSAPVQRVDNHDHGGKVLAIIALVAACFALGAVCMYVILAAQLIDAKIQAGTADARADANRSRVDARYAVAEVENLRTQLAGKGITIPKEH